MTAASAEQKDRFITSANRDGRARAVRDVVRDGIEGFFRRARELIVLGTESTTVPVVASRGVAAIVLDGGAIDVPIAAVGLE